ARAPGGTPAGRSGLPGSTGRRSIPGEGYKSRPAGTAGSIPEVIRAGGVDGPLSEDTLGGYQAAHQRPAAFGGSDGFAYSVAASADEGPGADGRYGAYLLFVRWREGADRPAGHLETDYLAFGATAEAGTRP